MSINQNYAASDRDMLIRLDADVGNLSEQVREVRTSQAEQERASQKLTENLTQLTYSVGAMVEGMKEARAMMHAVGKHDQRISHLETWKDTHAVETDKTVDQINNSLNEIKQQLSSDRKQWEPWVKLAGHWKWAAGAAAVFIGIMGWDTFRALMVFLFSGS